MIPSTSDPLKKYQKMISTYDGMVIEVYKPVQWFPGLTTFSTRQETKDENASKPRYEFVGRIAEEEIRKMYIGKAVAGLFNRGDQNPVRYIWGKDKNINY